MGVLVYVWGSGWVGAGGGIVNRILLLTVNKIYFHLSFKGFGKPEGEYQTKGANVIERPKESQYHRKKTRKGGRKEKKRMQERKKSKTRTHKPVTSKFKVINS